MFHIFVVFSYLAPLILLAFALHMERETFTYKPKLTSIISPDLNFLLLKLKCCCFPDFVKFKRFCPYLLQATTGWYPSTRLTCCRHLGSSTGSWTKWCWARGPTLPPQPPFSTARGRHHCGGAFGSPLPTPPAPKSRRGWARTRRTRSTCGRAGR